MGEACIDDRIDEIDALIDRLSTLRGDLQQLRSIPAESDEQPVPDAAVTGDEAERIEADVEQTLNKLEKEIEAEEQDAPDTTLDDEPTSENTEPNETEN